ncbi:hypothetical protein NLI96_g9866 [Meripilus lineatus]|uniref:Uncharacterized protein n=1 Tax=Meripilus lineatus TaxID=2056292 RepID=A0AAD5UUQ1_9APHY|nr:hypothetical protein NLI96_g9866 [Physisporinus lineatus]
MGVAGLLGLITIEVSSVGLLLLTAIRAWGHLPTRVEVLLEILLVAVKASLPDQPLSGLGCFHCDNHRHVFAMFSAM